jgi:hypothetical protein
MSGVFYWSDSGTIDIIRTKFVHKLPPGRKLQFKSGIPVLAGRKE